MNAIGPSLCLAFLWAVRCLVSAVAAPAQPDRPAVTWDGILHQPSAWYAGPEAARVAENVLLYQHDNGGWDKNIDMAQPLSPKDRAKVLAQRSAMSTIDNSATYTQIRFLARMNDATREPRYADAALRGID